MTRVLVLSGPNLGLLGERQTAVYGSATLSEIGNAVRQRARALDAEVRFEQSNHEGVLVDLLEEERRRSHACVINPGGLSHTSVVLLDAIRAFPGPVVEVHISNIHAREPFRRTSLTAEAARGVITGLGAQGYLLALEAAVTLAGQHEETAQ